MSLIKRRYTTMICLFVSLDEKRKERLSSLFELVIVIDEAIHRQVLDRLSARFDLLIDKNKNQVHRLIFFYVKTCLTYRIRSNL
jgi:hypothetical protein